MPTTRATSARSFEARVVTAVLITAAVVALLAVVWQSAQVFLLLFGGILLAVMLRSAGNALSRWTGLGVRWAIALVLIATFAAIGGAGRLAAPRVVEQAKSLQESVQEALSTLQSRAAGFSAGEGMVDRATEAGESMVATGALLQGLAGGFTTVFSVTAGLLIILASGIFMALSPSVYTAGLLRLIPPGRRRRAREVIETLGQTLQGWIIGQFLAMLFLFASTWFMLALMGVPLSFLLGLITGIMAFVPYIGPIAAAVPILLVAFIESPALALQVGLLFLALQTLEDNVVLPLVFQRTVELPPALLITGQLVLGAIFGILGIIFATPLTALAMVLVQQVYVADTLDDPMDGTLGILPELDGAPQPS